MRLLLKVRGKASSDGIDCDDDFAQLRPPCVGQTAQIGQEHIGQTMAHANDGCAAGFSLLKGRPGDDTANALANPLPVEVGSREVRPTLILSAHALTPRFTALSSE